MQTLLFLFVGIGRLTHEWTSSTTDRLWARLKQNWFYPSVWPNALDSTHQQTMSTTTKMQTSNLHERCTSRFIIGGICYTIPYERRRPQQHQQRWRISSMCSPTFWSSAGAHSYDCRAVCIAEKPAIDVAAHVSLPLYPFDRNHLLPHIPIRRDIHEHIRGYTHFPMWRFGRTSGTIYVPQSSNWYNVRFALLEIIRMKLCSTQDRGCCRWSAVHLRLVSRTLSASVTIGMTNECFGLFIFIIHRGPQSRFGGRWSWCMVALTIVMMLSCKSSQRTACPRTHARNHHV